MRSVINISVPEALAAQVRKEVRKGNFSSTSEFFRHLWRLYQTEKIARDVRVSRRQFAEGKGRALKSLRDLG